MRIIGIGIILVMVLPIGLSAQPSANSMVYQESVVQDEEEFTLTTPSCVVAEPVRDEIYVISRGMVHIFTPDLFPLQTLGKGDGVESPLGIAVDFKGNLYIAQAPTQDNSRYRISVYNRALLWERDIYLEGFPGAESFALHRMAVDGKGTIFVVGNGNLNALVLDRNGGFIGMITPMEDDREVPLNDVAIDASGRIYLLSDQIGRIYVYSDRSQLLFKFGQKGGVAGKLSVPRGIAVDMRGGLIYVVDYMRHAVSAYNYSDGAYAFEFGGLGWGEGWFQNPSDVDVDSSGRVLVADTFNNRVEVFKPEDLELGDASSGMTEAPDGG